MVEKETTEEEKQSGEDIANFVLAYKILHADFISPWEITYALDLRYFALNLCHTLPTRKELEWCRDNDMFLVPGPRNLCLFSTFVVSRMNTSFQEKMVGIQGSSIGSHTMTWSIQAG